MGMFQEVAKMNEAFGNPKGDKDLFHASAMPVMANAEEGVPTFDKGDADKQWARLEKQCKNILSEYNELLEGLAERNLHKVRDALCDINVFSLGAHHFLGEDADADMTAVVDALYSRFCKDEKHLRATHLHYASIGVDCYDEGEFPTKCLKSSYDQGMTIKDGAEVWEYPKGKFLKALGYGKPVFK